MKCPPYHFANGVAQNTVGEIEPLLASYLEDFFDDRLSSASRQGQTRTPCPSAVGPDSDRNDCEVVISKSLQNLSYLRKHDPEDQLCMSNYSAPDEGIANCISGRSTVLAAAIPITGIG